MRLSKESHNKLEKFFRDYHKDEGFVLPQTKYFSGWVIGVFTKLFGIYAISFGRVVLLAPHTIRKNEKGLLRVWGWLIAHECCHVLQYEREGFVGFLVSYLKEYSIGLRANGKLNINSHVKAYTEMKQEREAVEVEKAYIEWRTRNQTVINFIE